ncbi:hypothetical protein NG799_15445 [Laspinema sp. D1]|uniref:Uncharacterized protein n=1 Tax=Laspinema palackyanum D2a TaxID=2953684 RepID=A0ABT2MSK4_9CYAN|nr:hypothetical protein [Laspinema sp. D2b]MCT7967736.1 hypothetical protein [Laspinema sp. D2a]
MAIPYGIAPLTADCASLMRGDRACIKAGPTSFYAQGRSRKRVDPPPTHSS